jgi:hypothetical protein
MRRRYDHIDLRVRSLAEARPFYETLLPALGFTRDVGIEHWFQFEAMGGTVRLSFWASSSRHGMSPTNAGSPFEKTVRARSTVSVMNRKEVNSHCVHQIFPHSFTDLINRCLRELVGEAQSGHLPGCIFVSAGLVSATLWTWCARVRRMLSLQPLQ